MIETERRFLLKFIPLQIRELNSIEIEDYMILTGEPHPHIRMRRKGETYELTKKYPKQETKEMEMIEETITLNKIEFDVFKKLPHTDQTKKRYTFQENNYTVEVDLWEDQLQGLGIVEFEFKTLEEARTFTPTSYCLTEVTQQEWLAGGMLSGKSYIDIEDDLEKLNYHKL